MAHKVISVDADPSFPVLNLAQVSPLAAAACLCPPNTATLAVRKCNTLLLARCPASSGRVQAVLLVCYELYRCPVLQGGGSPGDAQAPQQPSPWGPPGAWATVAGGSGSASSQQMATQGELEGLMGRTFAELEDSGFFEERNKDESVRVGELAAEAEGSGFCEGGGLGRRILGSCREWIRQGCAGCWQQL
jgi:hypothetical protein